MSEAEIIHNSRDTGDLLKPGCRIDRYILLEQIGEGGTGLVFGADQDEPVRRRVALKIVKLGMDTKSVLARFEAERQALALMDHPGIAHVLDAGATESGRPYFVMEWVRGVKITEYGDQNPLTIRELLELFVQVCDAIQHAHQKGIIHRDIKPSNILVTTGPDGKRVPKVIDFGIAKAIGGQLLTDKTIFTASEMLIATPAYMSPEQAALVSTGVDTRSDIYSLGVLLYELLTGTTPFDTTELLKAGFDEVRRAVREEEPVRPSARLRTLVVASTANCSRKRRAEAPKLLREMRGDLDWIVMKALEKAPARRYATANGLAMDIKRYLSGQAVEARPPSASYKFRKLFLRNKLLFISLASIFFLLVVALVAAARLLAAERRAVHLSDALKCESEAADSSWMGKTSEAKAAFEKSMAIRKQYLNNEPPSPWTIKLIAGDLVSAGRTADAVELLHRIVTPSLLARRPYSGLCANCVDIFAAVGEWADAEPYAVLYIKLRPNQTYGYLTLTPLLVATTNLAGYSELRTKMITIFGDTTNISVASQIAQDCLMIPSSGTDLRAADALADLAVTHGGNDPLYGFFECSKALAAYRLGHYNESIVWARQSANGVNPWLQAEAYAVMSMAQNKLGDTNAAQKALAHCNQEIQDNMPSFGTYLSVGWRQWIIDHVLQSEAKRMIEGEATPGARLGDVRE